MLWTARPQLGNHRVMARKKGKELWPAWSTWALAAVAATTLLTVAVTLNDIF
jgi:hypothetical protein